MKFTLGPFHMPLKTETVLHNRYRIEEVLGQGGMGAVYRAFDINLSVEVAVKENLFSTEEYARQFRREATILASLRHPNLPRVTDHFVIDGQGQYLVMDFIAGEDLRERLERDGPVQEQEAIPWFLEICDALSYLHTRVPPILHRDVKPGNIKITPDGRAMLVDFGLAKVVDESGSTTTGAKAMTPGFSPPEQYGTGRTDPRTDIYSVGATMYAALTAKVPEDSLERAMGREVLTPVRDHSNLVSPKVARSVERSLKVKAEDRYQTVAEFAAALSTAADSSQPTMIRNYPYLERTMIGAGRAVATTQLPNGAMSASGPPRRWPVVAVLLVTLLLVVAGAAYATPDFDARVAALFGGGGSGPAATETDTPTALPSETAAVVVFDPTATPTLSATEPPTAEPTDAPTETPAVTAEVTPTGGGVGQLAFASNRTGIPQIFLINVDGEGLVQLTKLPDGACQPDWSPDGQRLVFTSPCRGNQQQYPGSSLWVMNVDGTGIAPLPTAPGGDYDPAWSPDGERIAFTSLRDGRPQIYVLELSSGTVTNVSSNSAHESQAAWSPTGTQLMFTTWRSGVSEIWFMPDFGENAQRFSRTGADNAGFSDWSGNGLVLFEREISGVPRLVAARFEDRGVPEQRICPEGRFSTQPMAEPAWSVDGRWIAFETWPSGTNHDIAIISESCTVYSELSSDMGLDFDPVWRP